MDFVGQSGHFAPGIRRLSHTQLLVVIVEFLDCLLQCLRRIVEIRLRGHLHGFCHGELLIGLLDAGVQVGDATHFRREFFVPGDRGRELLPELVQLPHLYRVYPAQPVLFLLCCRKLRLQAVERRLCFAGVMPSAGIRTVGPDTAQQCGVEDLVLGNDLSVDELDALFLLSHELGEVLLPQQPWYPRHPPVLEVVERRWHSGIVADGRHYDALGLGVVEDVVICEGRKVRHGVRLLAFLVAAVTQRRQRMRWLGNF
mmetsp:Transcript_8114/g.20273  ORF Transcript_8114/g.20273 Transcript_8114/m.20273 type:complete len:256 (-) Transcript_8114:363-1130(-)